MCEIAWSILGGFSFANTFHGKEGEKKSLLVGFFFSTALGICFLFFGRFGLGMTSESNKQICKHLFPVQVILRSGYRCIFSGVALVRRLGLVH